MSPLVRLKPILATQGLLLDATILVRVSKGAGGSRLLESGLLKFCVASPKMLIEIPAELVADFLFTPICLGVRTRVGKVVVGVARKTQF